MKNWMKIVIVTLLISCIALMGATGLTNSNQKWKPESANLAMRQVAHKLYSICGNYSEPIEAVVQKDETTFFIKVNEYIDYDQLPMIMDQAVSDFNLPKEYGVLVKDCEEDVIRLGYSYIALERNETVPCQGREHTLQCSLIELIIYKQEPPNLIWKYLLLTLLLGSVIGLLIYSYIAKDDAAKGEKDISYTTQKAEDQKISIGHFTFDHSNQSLIFNEEVTSLTFRESKLLHYLSTHTNQVLTREQIQANVWEDEGVIVGRSLDVFISRLRKFLKSDPSIKIKSVHGVGYRLEV